MTGLTPLQVVEHTVLERAKEIRLDLADDAARSQLRTLVDQAVRDWTLDFKRGLRTQDLADPDLVAQRTYRNLVGVRPAASPARR